MASTAKPSQKTQQHYGSKRDAVLGVAEHSDRSVAALRERHEHRKTTTQCALFEPSGYTRFLSPITSFSVGPNTSSLCAAPAGIIGYTFSV